MLEMGYAILDAGQGGSTTCSSESFKNADPAPNVPKQCFCDDRKTITTVTDVDFGEADATAASCQVCDRECSQDTEMTLTREIEK